MARRYQPYRGFVEEEPLQPRSQRYVDRGWDNLALLMGTFPQLGEKLGAPRSDDGRLAFQESQESQRTGANVRVQRVTNLAYRPAFNVRP